MKLKKILKLSNSIHIDGMDCDISTIDKIFSFAERHRCSVNHMDSQKINNLYLSYSKYGGSFVSLNEIKNRADLIMFLGVDKNQLCEKFLRKIKWSKKKVQSSIFFISPKQDTIHLKKNNLTYEKFWKI